MEEELLAIFRSFQQYISQPSAAVVIGALRVNGSRVRGVACDKNLQHSVIFMKSDFCPFAVGFEEIVQFIKLQLTNAQVRVEILSMIKFQYAYAY